MLGEDSQKKRMCYWIVMKKREVASMIIDEISKNGQITIPEISQMMKVTERAVQRYLKEFQESGILAREGSDKSGRWILL